MKRWFSVVPILVVSFLLSVLHIAAAPKQKDLRLTRIGNRQIQPVLYFPAGSQVQAVEILHEGGRYINVGYSLTVKVPWEQIYSYYQKKYKNVPAKWLGKRQPRNSPPCFVFTVFRDTSRRQSDFTIAIWPETGEKDARKYGMSTAQRRQPSIYAIVEMPELDQAIQQGQGFAIPLPSP